MRLLNFTHPLTADHLDAVAALTADDDVAVHAVPTRFAPQSSGPRDRAHDQPLSGAGRSSHICFECIEEIGHGTEEEVIP
ncbi:MAG: hypothetical protein M5U01_41975 [Ardenticatenaceae bacterium]|nr:hypothetical protein [Ardenticatenaceae bacterium]